MATKYIQSKRAIVNQVVNGLKITVHKVTTDSFPTTSFYRYAISNDVRELWFDSITFDETDRTYFCSSAYGNYTSIRKLVSDSVDGLTKSLATN